MGRYLDILERADRYDINDINDKTPTRGRTHRPTHNPKDTFGRISRLCRTLSALEARCPELVETNDWQQVVVDARSFIARWGKQAEKLGWTAKDLFGLFPVPPKPHPTFRRLSRHDATGLIWLLRGRPVVALTAESAAIESLTGAVTVYRKHSDRFNRRLPGAEPEPPA
jgi:hypothetical protein